MMNFLRIHQLNIMLSMASISGIITLFIFISETIPRQRKKSLIFMETASMFLLLFDRYAYIYRGNTTSLGYWMVRISNFIVFLMSLILIYGYNGYLKGRLMEQESITKLPGRLIINDILVFSGILLLVISQFTGFYYKFDSNNNYERSTGIVICYMIPLLAMISQMSITFQFKKYMRTKVWLPLVFFSVIPLIATFIQIYNYGISFTNITIVGMAVILYVFDLMDVNQLNRMKEEAERASSVKSRFLANISHELRTPLNTIIGMDEMILREEAANVPKSYFMSVINYALEIKTASDSLLSLINNLLDISLIESEKMHLDEEDYGIREMITSILSMVRGRFEEQGVQLYLEGDDVIPQTLHGDVGKLKQILLNILITALKFSENGDVKLGIYMERLEDEKCDLRFSVIFSNSKIRADYIERLFTLYEKMDNDEDINIKGESLGLSISKCFTELMQGKMWCNNISDEEMELVVSFGQNVVDSTPIGGFVEEKEINIREPYVPGFIAPDAEVLVVDDDKKTLEILKGLLKATKVFVTTASSGDECLDKIKFGQFSVVLIDHMMPGMDGVETMQKIRKLYPDLPVYALSTDSSLGEEYYKDKGFEGYLEKPVDSALLEKTIMKHIPERMRMKPRDDG